MIRTARRRSSESSDPAALHLRLHQQELRTAEVSNGLLLLKSLADAEGQALSPAIDVGPRRDGEGGWLARWLRRLGGIRALLHWRDEWSAAGDATVAVEPFDVVELELWRLWGKSAPS